MPEFESILFFANLFSETDRIAEVPAPTQAEGWQWLEAYRDQARVWATSGGTFFLAVVLFSLCVIFWFLNLVALPGNWLAIMAIGIYAWLGPQSGRAEIGLVSVAIAFSLGVLGEILEFAAGAVGVSRAGASRKATTMAIVGSMVGAITGGLIGLPIPVIGPVLAALLFGGFGATAGAMLAELVDGRSWRENWRIGRAAFWGRTTGTIGKMVAGLLVVLVCLAALLL